MEKFYMIALEKHTRIELLLDGGTPNSYRSIEAAQTDAEQACLTGGTAYILEAIKVLDIPTPQISWQDIAPEKQYILTLAGYDPQAKISTIKVIRSIVPAIELKMAKELVESAPCVIPEPMRMAKREEAERLLIDVGAQYTISDYKA